MVEIRQLTAAEGRERLDGLAHVLVDCVEGGASVSFMAPFSLADARAFFEKVLLQVAAGDRILLGAFDCQQLVGTVQILLAMPPNQPHRGEIAKLLVLRSARGRGAGRLLMERAEQSARAAGKTLLVLDTASGSDAERLYLKLGWIRAGVIPGFALLPDGAVCDTTFFWKGV